MDKVRERGAPLPGNNRKNWGNHHNDVIWRGRGEEGERRKKRKKRRGKGEKIKIEEEKEHGDDKFKLSKANERGKLGWNNKNEEG